MSLQHSPIFKKGMVALQVVLAEKPDQARNYAAPFQSKRQQNYIEIKPCTMFPDGAMIVWALGHLCENAPPESYDESWGKWRLNDLPMIPETFKQQIAKGKSKHFQGVKNKLRQADEIIIGTDPAREGELIARWIIQMAQASDKPLKRLWCSSRTPKAIQQAFGNLTDAAQTQPLYREALARSYSDWLVGINASRAYTLLMQKQGAGGVFSVGRCQTPVLCLIRQREKEIEDFQSEPFWELVADFDTNESRYQGKLYMDQESRFFKQSEADDIFRQLDGQKGIIQEMKTEEKVKHPPMLYNLSSLQSRLNQKYKMAPSQTLNHVQSLYEKGHVSYPRSDSQHLTMAEGEALPDVLSALGKLDNYASLIEGKAQNNLTNYKRYVNDDKVGDHYAIIPTDHPPDLNSLQQEEWKVYDEIVKSVIAAHYADHKFRQTTVTTDVAGYTFKSKGKQITENGWKNVWGEADDDDKQKDSQPLPSSLQERLTVEADVSIKEGATKPPKLYTQGQLITLMQSAGKTIDNEALSKEMALSKLALGTEATRADIIQTLIDRQYIVIEKNTAKTTAKGQTLVEAVDDTVLASAEMTAKWELYLANIGKGNKEASPFIEQSKKMAAKLVSDAEKQAQTWDFSGYITQIQQGQYLGQCPKCGEGIIKIPNQKFYGCTGYKSKGCDFKMPEKILGKKITATNVRKLLNGDKTGLIKGFNGKKTFDAYIVWKDKTKGEWAFEFTRKKKTRKRTGGAHKNT